MKHAKGIFLFHRDLRIIDNVGLQAAAASCDHLLLCFIFTPEQISPQKNAYRSKRALRFMMESLAELEEHIQHSMHITLTYFYGDTVQVLRQLIHTTGATAVHFNRDYTPYARQRDDQIQSLCGKLSAECYMHEDYYLHVPGTITPDKDKDVDTYTSFSVSSTKSNDLRSSDVGSYRKFTPFYEKCMARHRMVAPSRTRILPKTLHLALPTEGAVSVSRTSWKNMYIRLFGKKGFSTDLAANLAANLTANLAVQGGRIPGLAQLKKAILRRAHTHYAERRDDFTYETTYLSAYLKFGCVSVREVYHTFCSYYGTSHELVRQLIWREFFAHILAAHPEVLLHSGESDRLNLRLDAIRWRRAPTQLQRWKEGRTGFPLVDACMRQLNETGYMHNRGRMVVAYFLIKLLLIDWREGERYFAQQLVDYDVASNNGNWAAILGRGVYQMPFFRVMNPWLQSSQYDSRGEFIRRWVPELADVPPRDLHQWHVVYHLDAYKHIKYPAPMIDYDTQKTRFVQLYKDTYLK